MCAGWTRATLPVCAHLKAGQEQAFVGGSAVSLELAGGTEPDGLHDVADQSQQWSPVTLALLSSRDRVEQALPLRGALIASGFRDLERSDEVRNLRPDHRLSENTADDLYR